MVLDLGNPFFSDVARGVEAIADEHGLMVSVSSTGESPERERRYLNLIEEQRVHGLLITPVQNDPEHLDQLARRGTPVVLVDRRARVELAPARQNEMTDHVLFAVSAGKPNGVYGQSGVTAGHLARRR
jgi:DNA-binding LacI/PurR family transcriptional regulator